MIKMSKARRLQQSANLFQLIMMTDSKLVADKYWRAYNNNADRYEQQR